MKKRLRNIIVGGLGLIVAMLYVIPNPRVRMASDVGQPDGVSMGKVQFVMVEPNVALEIIDFGGNGRPLVLLAGLGDTAHRFTAFANKLAKHYHVYGITRRGFGASSVTLGGYTATRLGDDVVAVIDALKLFRPVLVAHSFGGEEMSSVAFHHPEKVSGLIYLDAGYGYALYDKVHGNRAMRISSVLKWVVPVIPPIFRNIRLSIIAGQEKFTELHVPVLAIFANPHDLSAKFRHNPSGLKKEEKLDRERTGQQVDAFERQVPTAKVVSLPHASHMIYESNEAEVLREMESFIRTLP